VVQFATKIKDRVLDLLLSLAIVPLSKRSLPVVRKLPADFLISRVFKRFADLDDCLWLDTAFPGPFIRTGSGIQGNARTYSERLGRYSFLTADPVDRIDAYLGDPSPWTELQKWCRRLPSECDNRLPPFQGGIAGLIGYESATWLEEVGTARIDDFPTPAMSMGLYDWVIATDHDQHSSWIISQGLGKASAGERFKRASDRADQVESWLAGDDIGRSTDRPNKQAASASPARRRPMPEHYVSTNREDVWSNFSSDQFRPAVAEIVGRIRRGDSFQVNLAQRLLSAATLSPSELYLRLRQCNPAPYGGYYSPIDRQGNSFQVLSSSPEGFLQIRGNRIETRPIKGTIPRTGEPAEDLRLAKQLSQSEKDRAENTMIVDLMRNDLSRICTDESVKVSQLCGLEQYEHVQHLVSVVQGELEPDKTAIDALKACFPGGSVTGAPKIEAMRTIAELEPHRRGPYCGSLGYISCGGNADFNILIRTITAAGGYWQIPVGGGVTARSEPEAEEAETWAKAEGMLRALFPE
jgi:para-aminobenzoate synthetase component 1